MKNLSVIFDLLAYEGSPTNNPQDCDKVKNSLTDEVTVVSRQQLVIADLTVDAPVTLPEAECSYMVILIDREISIKINGWTTALTLKPKAAGKKSLAFYAKSPMTGISISNSSGAVANIDVILIK